MEHTYIYITISVRDPVRLAGITYLLFKQERSTVRLLCSKQSLD